MIGKTSIRVLAMMRKVVRLDMYSVVRVFAIFYGLVGVCVASDAALIGDNTVDSPFGFAYPLAHAYITMTMKLPHPATWFTMGLILIATVFYILTGLISGATVVLLYNAVGKFWPLFSVQVQQEPQPPIETKTEEPLPS